MPLGTKFMHDGNYLRAQRDKYRLPAVSKLLIAEGHIHFMTHGGGKVFIANLATLMLVESLSHGEMLLQRRQRDAG